MHHSESRDGGDPQSKLRAPVAGGGASSNTPIARVRSMFHMCPVVYTDDPLALPQPVFPITDFISPVDASAICDIADACMDTIAAAPRPLDRPTVLVGTANRSVGAIVHELSRRTALPYSLANWYPPGTAGETLVCKAKGFGGDGAVFVNGLTPGERVLLVIDLLRSGRNLADMLRACAKAGCAVVGCLCVCEVLDHPGRETVRGFFDAQCPLLVLVQVSARGERTKVLGADPATLMPSMVAKTASISRLCVDDVLAPPSVALRRAQTLFGYTAAAAAESDAAGMQQPPAAYVPMTRHELAATLKRVAEPFYNIPIITNPNLKYPYCFMQLTDFQPLATAQTFSDMADLIVREANFNRCDVIVSEADRGGAPLAVEISRRTNKPFVLASWGTIVDSQVSDATSVGFSGNGRFFISGVRNGDRVIFVDDLISSGGTAIGVLDALTRCGATVMEAIFVGEKLQKAPEPSESGAATAAREQRELLPIRGGYRRLKAAYPDVNVVTLVQFTAFGTKTAPPVATVG